MVNHHYPVNTTINLSKNINIKFTNVTGHLNLQGASFSLYEKGRRSPFMTGSNIHPFLNQRLSAKVSPGTTSLIAIIKMKSSSVKKKIHLGNLNDLEVKL
jgi:hypothetical protein